MEKTMSKNMEKAISGNKDSFQESPDNSSSV